jgi:hypothetical protein
MSKLACQTGLNKIICLGCPVPGFIFQMSCQGCPATVIPSRWPCYNCPVLDVTWLSGPLFSVLSYYPDCPFFLFCLCSLVPALRRGCSATALLSLAVLSWCHVPAILSTLSCPGWPVRSICQDWSVPDVLSKLFGSRSPPVSVHMYQKISALSL